MRDERFKQVVAGSAVILALAGMFVVLGLATGLPGFAGEFARTVAGILTTPTMLEPAFLFLGLLVVLLLNHWRRQREGPEWVYLEQVVEPADLPERARFVVYPEPPLPAEFPDPLSRAEGAMAINDPAAVAEALAELSASELSTPAAIALRIQLARATGHDQLAAELAGRLKSPLAVGRSTT